jgi:hypothetical protein
MPVHAPNAEVLRLQYLQMLGITSYYPRFRLPGAKVSAQCEWPFAEGAVAKLANETTPVAEQAARVATAAAPRVAVEGPSRGPVREASRKEPAPVVAGGAGAATEAGDAVHLQLLLMSVDAELAVLNQIPALARPQLQERQQLLLGNILRWLGKAADGMHAPRLFKWPLPGLTVTNTRSEAGASLSRFLEQAVIEQPFRHLLVLGEHAADCLAAYAATGQAHPTQPWRMLTTHSLDEMLAMPQLKRAVWQDLLPLHAALGSAQASGT